MMLLTAMQTNSLENGHPNVVSPKVNDFTSTIIGKTMKTIYQNRSNH